METGKITITKLNGANCLIWSTQLEALLRARGLRKYVAEQGSTTMVGTSESTAAAGAKPDEALTSKQRSEVRAAIICTIEAECIPMVAGDMEPCVMWKKLSDANLSKCKAPLHTLRNRLLNMRLERDESIREYVNRICTIERQLAFSGTIVNDGDKKHALLNGIRYDFRAYGSVS